jgi:hypothetical protein
MRFIIKLSREAVPPGCFGQKQRAPREAAFRAPF